MISEISISEEYYNFLYLWLFLLCCLYLWMAGNAAVMKKYSFVLISVLICFLCFLELNAVKCSLPELRENPRYEILENLLKFLRFIRTQTVILASLYAVFQLVQIRKWQNHHITPLSIKECADGHPAGIVFWNNRGKVLFANATADYISTSLMNIPIMNGMEFQKKLGKTPVTLSDGSVWDYHYRSTVMDGDTLHELIAVNVTELSRKIGELEAETGRLIRMNEELKAYNRKIEELVRRQEILNAKVQVHDEMNHLLMATDRAFEETDAKKQNEILKLWEKDVAMLFQHNGNEQMTNIMEDLATYGKLIGIEFICDEISGYLTQEQRRFMVFSAREAMNNAVKHGKARHLHLFAEENRDSVILTYVNDGNTTPNQKIMPTGGLLHIKQEAVRMGGSFEVKITPGFMLIITIPKEEKRE